MTENPAVSKEASSRLVETRLLVLFGGSHLFGQERANIEVIRTLCGLGAEARFITSSRFGHSHVQPELSRRGFSWTAAPFGFHWSRHMFGRHFGYLLLNLYGVIATSWRVWREARNCKSTHIYAMSWSYFVFALPAIHCLKLPLIFRAGDALPEHTAFHRWVYRQLRKRVTSLVCNSQFVATGFQKLGFSPKVIYNYPPEREPVQPPPEAVRPAGAVAVIYVGQIAEHKGIVLLVDAVIDLIRDGRNLVLWILGASVWGDSLEQRLREHTTAQGVADRIQFFGLVENVPSVLRRADIHVCPSVWDEPSPNVVLEAKREALPTVAFSVGGLPELIEHRVNGYLCERCSAEGLSEGVRYYLADSKALKQAGKAARRDFEQRFGVLRFREQWGAVLVEN